jgi:cation transport ATPase
VSAGTLRKGDVILVKEGDVIPGDGEAVEGGALVDERTITTESAPVISESGGDRSPMAGVSSNPMVAMANGMSLNMILAMPQATQLGLTKEKAEMILAEINKQL